MLKNFSSNTVAGSGNQLFFTSDESTLHTARCFYKITQPGAFNYVLGFSNVMDSTFSNGKISHKNLICEPWYIQAARVAVCSSDTVEPEFKQDEAAADRINRKALAFTPLTFGGQPDKRVAPGEFFTCDPLPLSFGAEEYLCLELTFAGTMLPYHEESLLPLFSYTENGWKYDKKMPLPGFIGCDRPVRQRVGFLGDSITQGIGTPLNSYAHWNAVLSERLGASYAFWNLGLGYGRADDMASEGAWAYKAKQNDTLIVCYGVNDVLQGFSEEEIIRNLTTIVAFLKKAGKTVILQTVPPFDYSGEKIQTWANVNRYIQTVLVNEADLIFDTVPVLQKSPEEPHAARFGGHPNAEGCKLWGDRLYEEIKQAQLL